MKSAPTPLSGGHRALTLLARWIRTAALALLPASFSAPAHAGYAEIYCDDPRYSCRTIQAGESWGSLFPKRRERDLVMRINRVNTRLKAGEIIAVPNQMQHLTINALAPFPALIRPAPVNRIVVDQSKLAWAAYGADGVLVRWGPMSGGKDYCSDVKRSCVTRPGIFSVYYQRGASCASSKYPIGKGGAKMPYCMFYNGGYALHGSYSVPGRHDSHGCIRLFIDDAKWLSQEFVQIGKTRVYIDVEQPKLKRQNAPSDFNEHESSLNWP